MQPEKPPEKPPPPPLSPRERRLVVSVSLGFLALLSFLAGLSLVYRFAAEIPAGIQDFWRTWQTKKAAALAVTFVFYVAVLPGLIVLSLVAAVQGARGKRTAVTRWVLREAHQEHIRRQQGKPITGPEAIWADERAYLTYLPNKIGWAILIVAVTVGAAILAFSAFRR